VANTGVVSFKQFFKFDSSNKIYTNAERETTPAPLRNYRVRGNLVRKFILRVFASSEHLGSWMFLLNDRSRMSATDEEMEERE
jgi:hypothetical protein